MAKICVDTQGAVSEVAFLMGSPSLKAEAIKVVKTWRHKPFDDQRREFCYVAWVTFH